MNTLNNGNNLNTVKKIYRESFGSRLADFLVFDETIPWELIEKYGVIENEKIEGIYWEGDLDLSKVHFPLPLFSLIKQINGTLNIEDLSPVEQFKVVKEIIYKGIQLKSININEKEGKIIQKFLLNYREIKEKNQEDIEESYCIYRFEELLFVDPEEVTKLSRYVKETFGKISWEHLSKYTHIKDGRVEGIYWDQDLDIDYTIISDLWKIKKVIGKLNCLHCSELASLGDLSEVTDGISLWNTPWNTQLELFQKIVSGKFSSNTEYDGDTDIEMHKKTFLKYSIEELESLKNLDEVELQEKINDICQKKMKDSLGEDSDDYQELLKLKNDSDSKISWEKLWKYTKIEDEKVEGIYWGENLDISKSYIDDLWKIKSVDGILNCNDCFTLSSLGLLEYTKEISLAGAHLSAIISIFQRVLLGTLPKDIKFNLDPTLMEFSKVLRKYSLEQLEQINDSDNFIQDINTFCKQNLKEELSQELDDFQYLYQLSTEYPGGSMISWKRLYESAKIEEGKLIGIYCNDTLHLGVRKNIDISRIHKVGKLNISSSSIQVQLETLRLITNDQLRVTQKLEFNLDKNIYSYAYNLFNSGISIFIPTEELIKFMESIIPTIGFPEEREEEIGEGMNSIGICLMKNYVESVNKLFESPHLVEGNMIQKILEDREKKNAFFKKYFGEKIVETFWEDN